LRDKESDEDEAFVRNLCAELKIPLHVKKVDVNEKIALQNGNLQEVARNIRYDFFQSFKDTIDKSFLAIAHHQDDQIETFFLNLARKSGLRGMSCMLESNNEKISSFIEKNIEKTNELLLSKMTTMLNEIIPKNQETTHLHIENCMKTFLSSITQDTTKLLEITSKLDSSSKDDSLIKTFIDNIDTHLTQMFLTIQQPIFNSIQSSEERTNLNIQQIKENNILQQNIQEALRNEMYAFLNRFKNNSQFKGDVAETELQNMILSIMPSDEVIRVTSDTATCDIKVNRKDKTKPNILFESKNYKNSANTQEVKKFERDLQLQKMHGIFISQESPITFKDNFQIDIINGLIHVYIPNGNYEIEKIKIALDIIDNLSLRLNDISKEQNDEYSINKETLDEITEEYRLFGIQKMQMLETIRLVNKQLVDKLDEIQLPKMKKFLMNYGTIENDNDFKCNYCNSWSGKNKASLAAHIRNCKFNPKNTDIEINTFTVTENVSNEIINNVDLTIVDNGELVKKSKIRTAKK
jgi:hypothetical protein